MSLPKYVAIPFSVWYLENKEDVEREFKASGDMSPETSRCEECNGDGYVTCNMHEEHECSECDGKGKIHLTPSDVLYEYALDVYRGWVSRDFRKWTDYNKDMEGVVCQ